MATIYCFTSTGNSLYAAKIIAEKIGGKVAPMKGSATCGDNVIGFVLPVYFWGLPRIAARFIKNINIKNKEAYIFAVATFGRAAPGVLGLVNQLLKPKGVSLQYGGNLKMLDNYIPVSQVKDSEKTRQGIDKIIEQIAEAVARREKNRIQASSMMNQVMYQSYPDESSDLFFTVSYSCTGCAVCRDICPVKNISIKKGEPVFKHRCEHCLACLHNCPEAALDWGQKTKGRERYRNAGITLDELLSFNKGG